MFWRPAERMKYRCGYRSKCAQYHPSAPENTSRFGIIRFDALPSHQTVCDRVSDAKGCDPWDETFLTYARPFINSSPSLRPSENDNNVFVFGARLSHFLLNFPRRPLAISCLHALITTT